MRKATYLGVCLSVLGGACSLAEFDIEQNIPEQTIQGTPFGVLAQFFDIPIQIEIQAKIKEQETGPIDSITLKSLVFRVTSDDDDWGFVDSVDLFVDSTKEGSSLSQHVKVAHGDKPGAITSYSLTSVSGVNLLPYVEEGAELTAEAKGSAPPDDVSFAGIATFHVVPF